MMRKTNGSRPMVGKGRKLGRRLGVGSALLLVALSGMATDAGSEAIVLDRLVVNPGDDAARIDQAPRSLSVINAGEILRGTQQLALDEALAGVPGVYLQNGDNFAQDLRIAIRGFGARASFGIRGIKLLVDGIPETLPDGQAGVDSIDLASARRIEVLRGPASSQYGNAAGGVIAISSELGSDRPYVEARAASGAYGYRQWQLKSAGHVQDTDYLFSFANTRLQGYREHAQARGVMLNVRLGREVGSAGRLLVSLNHTDQPQAQDPGGVNAQQAMASPRSAFARNLRFDAGEALEQQRLGLAYRQMYGSGELKLRLHAARRRFSNRLPFESGGAVDLERQFSGGGVQYAMSVPDTALSLSVGLDHDRQDDQRKRFDNLDGVRGNKIFDQDEQVDNTGVFALLRYGFRPDWTVQAGLRYDRVSYAVDDQARGDGDDSGVLDFDALSPSLSLSHALEHGLLFASYSHSFETPSTTELANPDASGGFNRALSPQKADNYELGFRYGEGRLSAELAAFFIALRDELLPFEIAGNPGRTFYVNAGRSSRTGVEGAVNWQPATGVAIDVAYTWSDFRFDRFSDADGVSFAGKRLPGLPQHFAYARISLEPRPELRVQLEAQHAGTLYADNANAVSVPGYRVVNLRLSQDMIRAGLHWRVFLGINNLLDERYYGNVRINAFGGRYFEPAPDRHLYAGLSLRFVAEASRPGP